ncbi:MAG: OmpA family protein, partial [Bacteroidaceae bacterium]|nr:OmpA family protein [Bacteroidaceae bacterium]
KEVEIIKEVEKPIEIVKTVKETTQLAPVVIFQLGKSTVDASQRPSVAMIATYMKNHPTCKVAINGYASPEGNPELNQKLSDARAKAVYDMLVNTYKIPASRLSYKGLGVTDELFDENDWNRVATFIEESK